MTSALTKVFKALFGKNDEGKVPADDPEVAEFIKTLTEGEKPEEKPPVPEVKPETPPAPEPVSFSESAAFKAQQAKIDALMAAALKRSAEDFADDVIKVQQKALPQERDALVAQFIQAWKDDEAAGTANFSVAGSNAKSRVELLKQTIDTRRKNILYQELVAGDIPEDAVVFGASAGTPTKPNEKSVAELRSFSTVLAAVDRAKKERNFTVDAVQAAVADLKA